MLMVHLLDHLRNLRARVDSRAHAAFPADTCTTFCDACASICTGVCRHDAQRLQQDEVRLYTGITRR